MAFRKGILARGTLPTSKGVLYIAPPGGAEIAAFRMHNPTATDGEAVKVYVKTANGTSDGFGQATLDAGESARAVEETKDLPMGEGDTFEGSTTTAATIHYSIIGREGG